MIGWKSRKNGAAIMQGGEGCDYGRFRMIRSPIFNTLSLRYLLDI